MLSISSETKADSHAVRASSICVWDNGRAVSSYQSMGLKGIKSNAEKSPTTSLTSDRITTPGNLMHFNNQNETCNMHLHLYIQYHKNPVNLFQMSQETFVS